MDTTGTDEPQAQDEDSTPEDDQEGEPAPEASDRMSMASTNLLADMTSNDDLEWVKKQASKCIDELDEDEESRADFITKRANYYRLYSGDTDAMQFPSQGGKKPFIPVITKAVLKLWSNILEQVAPSNGEIVQAVATDISDEDRQARVTKRLNWEVRRHRPNYRSSISNTIVDVLLSGSTFRGQWRDEANGINVDEDLSVDEIVLCYTTKSTRMDLADVPRYHHRRPLARHVIEDRGDSGEYINVDRVFKDSSDSQVNDPTSMGGNFDKESQVQEVVDKIVGIEKPKGKLPGDEREIVDTYKWLRLPGEKRYSPVIFTVERENRVPLSLRLREEPDPFDKMRFDREMKEYEMAMQAIAQQYQMQVQQHMQEHAQAMQQHVEGQAQGLVPPDAEPPQLGEPPQQPEPPEPPMPPKTRQICPIVHFRLFPHPVSFYGIGIATMLEGNAELANELAGQFIIAAQMHNVAQGLAAKGALPVKGDHQLVPGKMMETELEPEQLQQGFKFLQTPPADVALAQFATVQLPATADSITVDTDLMGGASGGSHETAKGIMERKGMAMAIVGSISSLIQDGMKQCFKNLARLDGLYLDNADYYATVSEGGQVPPGAPEDAARLEMVEDWQLTLTADQRLVSKDEQIAAAGNNVTAITKGPLAQRPELVKEVYKQYFHKMENTVLEQLVEQAFQQAPPPEPMSQENETQGFLNEKDHPVMDTDDHADHLHKIQTFRTSKFGGKLSSTGKQMLDSHERAHYAKLYGQAAGHAAQKGETNGNPTQQNAGTPQGPGAGLA